MRDDGRRKVLLICRPAVGVDDPVAVLGPHLAEEMRALRDLRAEGVLLEAYTTGGSGAVLVVELADVAAAHSAGESLPLREADLIDVEVVELHPIRGLGV